MHYLSAEDTNLYKSLERIQINETIAQHIFELVKKGIIKSGDKLPTEKVLSEKMQVSRSSVREALHRLVGMNLITNKRGQGYYVNEIDIKLVINPQAVSLFFKGQHLFEIHEVRKSIEPDIIYLATQRATESDFRGMDRIFEKMEKFTIKESSIKTFYELGMEIHNAIAKASGNSVFETLMRLLSEMAKEAHAHLYIPFTSPEMEIGVHRDLYKAVKSGNPSSAVIIMREHLADAETVIRSGYNEKIK